MGRKTLCREYHELAIWAKVELGIAVLNISYHQIRVGKVKTNPGIKVVLEFQEDYDQVVEVQSGREKWDIQQKFAEQFRTIVRENGISGYEKDNLNELMVSYAAFSKVSVVESLQEIDRDSLNLFKKKYAGNHLWEILINVGQVIIFYIKESDYLDNQKSGINDQIETELVALASQHDEFGYVNRASVSFYYDSKENFDQMYEGKWHYYFK
ncbi:MAG: hypothetical protein R3D00_29285 [Bacteroidia bacterium]